MKVMEICKVSNEYSDGISNNWVEKIICYIYKILINI